MSEEKTNYNLKTESMGNRLDNMTADERNDATGNQQPVDHYKINELFDKIKYAAQMIEFNSTYKGFDLNNKLSGIQIWVEDIEESISSINEIKN